MEGTQGQGGRAGALRRAPLAGGIAVLVVVSCQVLVGFFYFAHLRTRIGRSEWSAAWLLVPGVNLVVLGVTTWRYVNLERSGLPETGPRSIRGRLPLHGAAALGFAALAVNVAVVAQAQGRADDHEGWLVPAHRDSVVARVVDTGLIESDAVSCVTDHVERSFEDRAAYEAASDRTFVTVIESTEAC